MNGVQSAPIARCQPIDGGELTPHEAISAGLERAVELADASHAPATIRAYQTDIAEWSTWAETHGVAVFPVDPAALAAYVGHLDGLGRSVATIERRISALAGWHRAYGHAPASHDPAIGRLLRGLRRTHAGEKTPKRAFTPDLVREFITHESTSTRDRALAAVAFVTGLRASELAALEWTDLEDCPDTAGFVLRIRRAKTDQSGKGAYVGIPRGSGDTCPVRLLVAWRAETSDARIFPITARTILRLAKRIATLAGVDPASYGAHSFRSGMCTVAARAGVSLAESMQASRHKSATVAASYVQSVTAGTNQAHAAAADALASK